MKNKKSHLLRATLATALMFLMFSTGAQERQLHVLNWSELIPQTVQSDFSAKNNIRLHYDIQDSDDTLESKLLTGHSGYDVVYPSSSNMVKQIQAGAYAPLDWSKIPNRTHLDAQLLKKIQTHDQGNQYGVPFLWGTDGMLVNVPKVKAILGENADLNSYDLLFNPAVTQKLAKCGISFLDSPQDVFSLTLAYLGRDPNSTNPEDYKAAYEQLRKVWPDIKQINSTYRDQITREDICVAMAWSGDAGVINRIIRDNKLNLDIRYITPKGQTPIWFTMMGIPKDAQNKEEAYAWINNLLDPTVAKVITEYNSYPSSVQEAQQENRTIKDGRYAPDEEEIRSFYTFAPLDLKSVRVMTQYWRRLYSK
ncbi:extracellular solute-binding protein [Pseudomonas gingeri]|uniref:extracellular solute-binding protein n=1 Tax=Pseudomonas gingeri TaxID=117681 RepID=UPI00159FDA31|nr:extracellular solute-binding protein [Pseudomonas gingeri]NVZ27967.1 extracellular solute-binding protein [Pseudomonas gingeri]